MGWGQDSSEGSHVPEVEETAESVFSQLVGRVGVEAEHGTGEYLGKPSVNPLVEKNKTTTTIFELNLKPALLNIGQVSVLVERGPLVRGTLSYSSLTQAQTGSRR